MSVVSQNIRRIAPCLPWVFFVCMMAWTSVSLANEPVVARAQFTTVVENREPVDHVVILNTEHEKIYFFTELRYLNGQVVTHRWEYNGQVEAEVEFEVGSDRWRVYSSKTLTLDKLGEWTATVVDGQGWPLKSVIFEYSEAPTRLME